TEPPIIASMLRGLALFVIGCVLAGAAIYTLAGRTPPPNLTIEKPGRLVGQRGELEVTVAPRARLSALTIALEQNGRSFPLFSLAAPQTASVTPTDADPLRIARPFGKEGVPDLQPGRARIVVSASRRSFWNLRTVAGSTSKDFEVRLAPPRLAVLSTHHYVN